MERRQSVKILLDMELSDLQKMSRADLARNVSKLASAGNKRIVRMQKSGTYSPAVDYVLKNGGKFSVAGKTKEQLIVEYNRAADFLTSKTGTIRGAKKWQKDVAKGVKGILKPVNPKEKKTKKEQKSEEEQWIRDFIKREKDFWKLYQRISDTYVVSNNYEEVWKIIDEVQTEYKGKTFDEQFSEVEKRWEKFYHSTIS